MEGAVGSMTNLLAAATSLFTWVFTNLATVASTIMAEGNSILLLRLSRLVGGSRCRDFQEIGQYWVIV